ncbi:MAG TPA: hypothetical protein VNQ73_14450 [Ilumatobacter sp.]|nr:hypothetical protein [Ilumatobacter sp.]
MGDTRSISERWDLDALRSGGAVALVFAVPFSLTARWAAESRDDTVLATWLTAGAVIGFVLGAGCAAWVQRRGLPISHGIVTAVGTYTAAQTVFIAVRLLRGSDVNWFAALFNLSVVAGAGLIGGLLGARLARTGARPTEI